MSAPPAAPELNCVPEQHSRRRRRKVKYWAIALQECGVSDGMHTAGRETQARLFIRISFLPRQDIELAVFLLGFMASLYPRFMKMYLLYKMLFFSALLSCVVVDQNASTCTPPFRYVFKLDQFHPEIGQHFPGLVWPISETWIQNYSAL